jgi:hypothetical protein
LGIATPAVNTTMDRYGRWKNFTANWNSGSARSVTIKIIDRERSVASNDPLLDDISLVQNSPATSSCAAAQPR